VYGYSQLAQHGYLGPAAAKKYAAQDQGQFGVITRGRPEIFISTQAVLDSPVVGHGSWAKDPRYVQLLRARGFQLSPGLVQQPLIPTHSYIMGAWVDGGILGVPIWLWVFALAVRALFVAYRSNHPLVPLASFASLSLLWDIVFSPYGGSSRLVVPFYVLLLVALVRPRHQPEEGLS
jgi:hypothetical protein